VNNAQWAQTLRAAAAKANPALAHTLRQLAERHSAVPEDDATGEWIVGPAREPGEEG
jgi:hypothetical protein